MFTKDVTFLEEGDEVMIAPDDGTTAVVRYQVVRGGLHLVGSEGWVKQTEFIKRQQEGMR